MNTESNFEKESFMDIGELSFDFETGKNGKGRYLCAELFSLAGRKNDGSLVSGSWPASFLYEYWYDLKLYEKKLIFHNAKFDLQVLKAEGFDIENINFEDTMVQAHLIDENRRKGLKDLSVSVLNKPKRFGWKDIDKFNYDEYLIYNKKDAEDTLELYEVFKHQILSESLDVVYNLEKKVILSIIDMEFNGVKIDLSLLNKQEKIICNMVNNIKNEIYSITNMYNLNFNSPLQLQRLFYDTLKVKPKDSWSTKTGYSTDEKVLKIISGYSNKAGKVAKLILKYRKYSKLNNTFIQILKNQNNNGYIFTSFNSVGTSTGRLSCSNPNLHQIPKKEFHAGDIETHIRSLFICENDEYFITADYSQIELRMMAELSEDQVMCKAFRDDIDIHSYTAKLLNSSRDFAKEINYSIVYGLIAESLANKLGISVYEAKSYIEKFWMKYYKLAKFMKEIREKVSKLGYLRTISGRKRRFSTYDSKVARQAQNAVIQGSSADLLKLALVFIRSNIDKSKARLVMNVHDEISIVSKKEYAEECKEIIKYCMENALLIGIPIVAEPKIGNRWSENK